MNDEVVVEVVNLDQMLIYLSGGETVPITEVFYDEPGLKPLSAVAGPDSLDRWFSIDLSEFTRGYTQ